MSGIAPITLPGDYELDIAELFASLRLPRVWSRSACLRCSAAPSAAGRGARAISANETRTTLVGCDTRRHKLLVFVIGGAIAGLAGGLYAAWGGFADPSLFGLEQATLVVAWSLVGGRTSVLGAFVGAFALQQLTTSVTSPGTNVTPLVVGAESIGATGRWMRTRRSLVFLRLEAAVVRVAGPWGWSLPECAAPGAPAAECGRRVRRTQLLLSRAPEVRMCPAVSSTPTRGLTTRDAACSMV